jgi:hypothetical protein
VKLSTIFTELASHGSAALSDGPRIIIVHPDFSTSIPPSASPTTHNASDSSPSAATPPIPAPMTSAPPILVAPVHTVGKPADGGAHSEPPPATRLRKIRSDISIGDIVHLTQRAGFGFIMAFIAIVSVPFVGMSLPFGLAIASIAWQLLIGRKEPWLPQRVRNHLVSIRTIDIIALRIARLTKGMEKVLQPRLTFLTSGIMLRVLAFCILIQAIGLAAPLPIPGSNWFFIIPIVVFSVALMEEDGALVLIGYLLQIVQIGIVFIFWAAIKAPTIKAWHMVHGWFGG